MQRRKEKSIVWTRRQIAGAELGVESKASNKWQRGGDWEGDTQRLIGWRHADVDDGVVLCSEEVVDKG